MWQLISLACLLLLCEASNAHIQITSPTIGVRPLSPDSTTPCVSTSPTSPRLVIPLTSTPCSAMHCNAPADYNLPISIYSPDTHGGGNASLSLGYGTNPSVYSYPGPSVDLTPTYTNATLYFTLPYFPSEGVYGTIQLYFTAGPNYQCLDIQWGSSGPTAPPAPTIPSPVTSQPTPPAPYVPWPTGVIGRSLTSSGTASYFLFYQPSVSKLLCSWEYASAWQSWGSWFNQGLGTYDSATFYVNTFYTTLKVNRTEIGAFNFGICPHSEIASFATSLSYLSNAKALRAVQATPDQLVYMYQCLTSSCSFTTMIYTVNSTSGSATVSGIPHVYADSGTYDLANNVTVVADSSKKNVWFFDGNYNAFGLSNFTGLVDSFICARIHTALNKTFILATRNTTALLFSIDMKSGLRSQISLTVNSIAFYTEAGTQFSFVIDASAGLLWGSYAISSRNYGIFSIGLSTGVLLASPFESLDPSGLIVHS